MAKAERKIKALRQSEILIPPRSLRNGKIDQHCFEAKINPGPFLLADNLLIDFFRLYDKIPKRKSAAIPNVPV